MKIDRKFMANFDWVILSMVLALSMIGIMTIFSATRPLPGGEQPAYFIKQLYWLLISVIGLLVMVKIDYAWLNKAAFSLFVGGIILLILVPLAGKIGMGAKRWITLGPVSFQPSEFFKLAFLVVLARYLSDRRGSLTAGNVFFSLLVFAVPPVALIINQPDLGTSLMILALYVLLLLAKGIRKRVAAFLVAAILISAPFVGTIVWDGLKDYQKKRILAFIQPEEDTEGMSYHVHQSKVAVGSGGIAGKGYLKGTQGPFRFLPEKHTDFIFSIYAEEWGFVGSVLVLAAYLLLILRGLQTAHLAKDEFGRLLALGITFLFSLYTFVNIAMTLGLMPVVGVPLPFMSYGGTALLSNYLAAGILINIRARRFELFY
jgi:rod shape determining protein RodA